MQLEDMVKGIIWTGLLITVGVSLYKETKQRIEIENYQKAIKEYFEEEVLS